MKVLVKTFDNIQYAKSFINLGEMLFSPTKQFSNISNDDVRCDVNEGVICFPAFDDGLNKYIGVKYIAAANIYCMTLLNTDEYIDSRVYQEVRKFGKYSVVILDFDEFINKINKVKTVYKKNNTENNLTFGKVEYINGVRPHIFRKAEKFKYENEFRVVCMPPILSEKNFIYIGKIESAILINSNELREFVEYYKNIR